MALPKVSGGTSASAHKLAHVHGSPITAAASEWNDTLATLDDKLSKYIGGNPVRLDGKPRASGILDTVRSTGASLQRVT